MVSAVRVPAKAGTHCSKAWTAENEPRLSPGSVDDASRRLIETSGLSPSFPARALPHKSGKTLQRDERLTEIRPVLQLVYRYVVARLAASAPAEESARDFDHMRRTQALVDQRRPAARAETSDRAAGFVMVASDVGRAFCDAKALAPATHIGRVSGTMRAPACARVIMPGPARGNVDLELDRPAQATTNRNCFRLRYRLLRDAVHAGPMMTG
jgi:hypothetical protein